MFSSEMAFFSILQTDGAKTAKVLPTFGCDPVNYKIFLSLDFCRLLCIGNLVGNMHVLYVYVCVRAPVYVYTQVYVPCMVHICVTGPFEKLVD